MECFTEDPTLEMCVESTQVFYERDNRAEGCLGNLMFVWLNLKCKMLEASDGKNLLSNIVF
jgi:hypothetical protein